MKVITYHADQSTRLASTNSTHPRLGAITPAGVLDVTAAGATRGDATLGDPAVFFRGGIAALDRLHRLVGQASDGPFLGPVDELTLAPTVPEPAKILCVGLNYRKHAAESGMAEPGEPVLFSKFNNALAAHREKVSIQGLTQVDYESELGLVIGTGGKNISEEAALDHVLGYLNANDISERALQMRSGQWLLGKSLDGFLPLGPVLVTADEAGDPQDMDVKGWLNGELRQNSSTADMIFSVAEIVAYASRYFTLQPGDVIVTGTPEGVILGRTQKDWLVPGDRYVVEVGPLGQLETEFR